MSISTLPTGRSQAGLLRGANLVRGGFGSLTLFGQFSLIMSPIVILGILGIGIYVSEQVEESMMRSVAGTAALYSKSLFEPHVQELQTSNVIPPSQAEQLDVHLARQISGGSILGIRVWKGDTVAYSNDKASIGRSYPPSELRQRAFADLVSVIYYNGPEVVGQSFPSSALWRNAWSEAVSLDPRLTVDHDRDDPRSHSNGRPVLEIYVPVRETGTNKIIAVVESYQIPVALGELLTTAQVWSWIEVGSVALITILVPTAIVRRGSRTIDSQKRELQDRVQQLTMLLAENQTLHERVNSASQRVADMNEKYLRRLGSDLHDGPVQLIGASLLRLGSLDYIIARMGGSSAADAAEDVSVIRDALAESLDEIRHVASGLVPVGIETMTLADVIRFTASKHEHRTAKPVALQLEPLSHEPPQAIKVCVYRVVQEGLNNAFHHAAGTGQRVSARIDGNELEVVVADGGPGVVPGNKHKTGGQGLAGLRDRVEALSGHLAIESRRGGTRLMARFPVIKEVRA